VWIYTQSNIKNIIYSPEYITSKHTQKCLTILITSVLSCSILFWSTSICQCLDPNDMKYFTQSMKDDNTALHSEGLCCVLTSFKPSIVFSSNFWAKPELGKTTCRA
jgi:hypothetical protein